MSHSLRISHKFYQVPEDKQAIILDLVAKNFEGKMDAYLKQIGHKPDAEIHLNYKIQQNKQGRYESNFLFTLDGKQFSYTNKVAFKYVEDLVNHVFLHFKETLSK